jgi:hypothetical protein
LRHSASQITSVEHSAEWLEKTEQKAPAKRPSDFSKVIPLRRCWNRLRLIESFDVESDARILGRLRQANLILVDSPPNPAKREHALFVALQHAPVGGVIVLDDLEVGAVSRFAQRLARQNPTQFRFWKLDMDHELGIFLKLRSGRVRSRPTLREFVGAWLRV